MRSATMDPNEQRLTEALTGEAEGIEPSPAGLSTILARIGDQQTADPVALLETARRRRHRRNGVVAGVLAVGMAAAATIFAVTGGIRREAVPDPATTLTAATSPLPNPPGKVQFDTPRPSVAREVYRVGDDPKRAGDQPTLFIEYVRNGPPYAPRQSLDALFDTASVNRSLSDVLSNGRNEVASTKETDDAIVVDMAAVDTQSRPVDAAAAAVWVQAWVDTIQAGYSSDKPVLITLQGRPTTLYGYIDTSRPIARDPGVKPIQSHEIFLPRDGEEVASPIDLASNFPAGDYGWKLVNLGTGFEPDIAGEGGSGGFSSIGDIDVPPGRYRATKKSEPDSKGPDFTRSVTFTVVKDGPAAPPSSTPVTNPPVGAVSLTPVYFAGKGPGLIEEWRPRSTAEAAVQTLFDGATGSDLVDRSAWKGAEVRSVTRSGNQVIVDVTLPPSWPAGRLDPAAAQALVYTATGYFGDGLSVLLSYPGHSVPLAERGAAKIRQEAGPFLPISDTTVGLPLTIVGGVPDATSTAIWYITDGVTGEPLFQGETLIDPATKTYAFTLKLNPGRYNLLVSTRSKGQDTSVGSAFTVR